MPSQPKPRTESLYNSVHNCIDSIVAARSNKAAAKEYVETLQTIEDSCRLVVNEALKHRPKKRAPEFEKNGARLIEIIDKIEKKIREIKDAVGSKGLDAHKGEVLKSEFKEIFLEFDRIFRVTESLSEAA